MAIRFPCIWHVLFSCEFFSLIYFFFCLVAKNDVCVSDCLCEIMSIFNLFLCILNRNCVSGDLLIEYVLQLANLFW